MRLVAFDTTRHGNLVSKWMTDEVLYYTSVETPDITKPMFTVLVFSDNGQAVGWIEAFNVDEKNKKCEIGICFPGRSGRSLVVPACWKFGEVIRKLFGIHRITTRILATNNKAIRLVEYLGLQKEGVERESSFKDGKFIDIVVYGGILEEILTRR